eukprot:TRINITY_DN27295_c0_g1_i1.p1 TRINITY_DN27295_c0_g1~~TRINITY_DN27295_c0_g1_i1.p1  ORF type:complete len:262 (+),score=22.34 TRINITY_DN27295_c0_g1_i1:67-786(+)
MPFSLEKSALSVALGIVVNTVYAALYSETLLDGSPLWSWYSATLYQAVSFPIISYLLVADKGFPEIRNMANCSWENAGEPRCGSMMYEEILMYMVISYFVKDMFVLLRNYHINVHFILHHLVCIIGSYVILNFSVNGGVSAFSLGITELEFGSFVMSRYLLNPSSPFLFYSYLVVMTISNLIAAIVLPYYLFAYSETNIQHVILVVTSVVLSVTRQLALGNHAFEWYKKSKEEGDKKIK